MPVVHAWFTKQVHNPTVGPRVLSIACALWLLPIVWANNSQGLPAWVELWRILHRQPGCTGLAVLCNSGARATLMINCLKRQLLWLLYVTNAWVLPAGRSDVPHVHLCCLRADCSCPGVADCTCSCKYSAGCNNAYAVATEDHSVFFDTTPETASWVHLQPSYHHMMYVKFSNAHLTYVHMSFRVQLETGVSAL